MPNTPGPKPALKVTYTHEEDLLPPPTYTAAEEWKHWLLWAGLLAGLVLLAHLPIMGGKLQSIYQDDANIVQNPFLMSGRGWIAIWRFPHSQFQQFSPLGYSFFWLERNFIPTIESILRQNLPSLFSDPLRFFRLVSIGLHLLNALLLWTLLRKLEIKGAWLAAAVFAVHPLQVQSVQWLSAQPVLLATFLGLCSLILYLRYCGVNPPAMDEMAILRLPTKPWILYTLALLLFILAVLAKPWLAVLPLMILIIIWWERGSIRFADIKPLLLFASISLLTLAVAILIVFRDPLAAYNYPGVTMLQKITAAGRVFWHQLLGFFIPYPLVFAYPRWAASTWQLFFIPLIFVALIVLWRYRIRFGRALPAGGALFVLAILPTVLYFNENTLRGAYLADFTAYLAVAILAAGVVPILVWKFAPSEVDPTKPSPWIATLLLLGLSAYCIVLSIDYRSPEKLLQASADHYSDAYFARVSLAEMHLADRRQEDAENEFRAVLMGDPSNRNALMGMASIVFARGEVQNALGQYLQVLQQFPNDLDAQIHVSLCHLSLGDSNRALLEAEELVNRDRTSVDAWNNLAYMQQARGDYPAALKSYTTAVDLAPTLPNPRINRASLNFMLGDFQSAEDDIMAVVKHNPNNFEAFFNAASMIASLAAKSTSDAEREMLYDRSEMAFRYAVGLRPDSAIAYFNLGKLLFVRQRYNDATFCFRQAKELDPNNQQYAEFLEKAKALSK